MIEPITVPILSLEQASLDVDRPYPAKFWRTGISGSAGFLVPAGIDRVSVRSAKHDAIWRCATYREEPRTIKLEERTLHGFCATWNLSSAPGAATILEVRTESPEWDIEIVAMGPREEQAEPADVDNPQLYYASAMRVTAGWLLAAMIAKHGWGDDPRWQAGRISEACAATVDLYKEMERLKTNG